MTELLLYQLYGPLASWGEPAVGEYRPSATHPGKAQIAGLLGAALGLTREREEALLALASGYGLAVRIDAEGELLRDYHTTQVPPARQGRRFHTRREELAVNDLYTILSQRDYRVEAAWTCLLWPREDAPYSLPELVDAMKRPRLTLYLGRKSCPPALPLNPRIVRAASLKSAFAAYAPDMRIQALVREEHHKRKSSKHRYFWEEPLPAGMKTGFSDREKLWVAPRRDLPLSRQRWQFAVRDEHHAIA